jgi:hypothetical protein
VCAECARNPRQSTEQTANIENKSERLQRFMAGPLSWEGGGRRFDTHRQHQLYQYLRLLPLRPRQTGSRAMRQHPRRRQHESRAGGVVQRTRICGYRQLDREEWRAALPAALCRRNCRPRSPRSTWRHCGVQAPPGYAAMLRSEAPCCYGGADRAGTARSCPHRSDHEDEGHTSLRSTSQSTRPGAKHRSVATSAPHGFPQHHDRDRPRDCLSDGDDGAGHGGDLLDTEVAQICLHGGDPLF